MTNVFSVLLGLSVSNSGVYLKKYNSFFSPRTIPAVGVIFLEERTAIRQFSGLKKRDVRQLYRTIDRKVDAKSWILNSKLRLPTYGETKYAFKQSESNSVNILTKVLNNLSRFRVWIARNTFQKLPQPMKRVVKKIGRVEAKVHKKLACLTPRLKRRFGNLFYPNSQIVPRSIFPDFEVGDSKGTFHVAKKNPI